jgi:broad specificity phosphatase PhoE
LKLILVRHGETHWNKEGRVQGGGSDIELNDKGLAQVGKLAAFLKDESIAAIVSSPMLRAVATAEAIASSHGLPVKVDQGLKELDVGSFEGMSLSNLPSTFSQFLLQWGKKAQLARLPGGESLPELQERSWRAVEPLMAEHNDGSVVVVSHYFVTLAIIFRILDLPLDCFTKFKLDLGGMSVVEIAEYGPRLVLFNNTAF